MPYNFVPDSFHTAVTAEALQAKIDRKSTILHQRGHFDPKFQVQGVTPTNNFCEFLCVKTVSGKVLRAMNALQLCR